MDGWGFKGQIGASDIGLTAEGPLGDRTCMILSVRRSYLQFLFSLLELPFLPTYNDFTLKVKHKINDRSEITLLGIGAIDNFDLNLDANETESQQYILNNLPVNEQWNYSTGIKFSMLGLSLFPFYTVFGTELFYIQVRGSFTSMAELDLLR